MVRSDHFFSPASGSVVSAAMKNELVRKRALAVRCPTCGASGGRSVSLPAANRVKDRIEIVDWSQKIALILSFGNIVAHTRWRRVTYGGGHRILAR
jgi:hypothetical protein